MESATDTATGVFDAEAALAAGVSDSDVADDAATYTAAGNDVVGMTSSVDAQTTPQARTVAAGAGIIAICKAASREKQAIYLNVYVTGGVGCWGQ
ncbi:hypothetical protein RM52_01095 [Microbacterium hominis]|uniref:Uncharacterized protein n=1 Tax=Microbacterium hominis TaxID=162426 RepID=A0A0B4CUB6_9MICO|nr:hypothetical protein RM52_01095 [Microbacterium hominis]